MRERYTEALYSFTRFFIYLAATCVFSSLLCVFSPNNRISSSVIFSVIPEKEKEILFENKQFIEDF